MAKLFLKKDNTLNQIDSNDICFFQANEGYSWAIGENTKYILSMRINELADLFIEDAFIQVHRSFLINIDKIDSIDLISSKILICKHEIPISRNKKNNLLERLKIIK